MAKRFRIGLNYFFDNQTNSGIVNYIFNIISALNTLPDDEKPFLVIFHSENAPTDYLKSIDYPYIKYYLFQPYTNNKVLTRLLYKFEQVFKLNPYSKFCYFNKIDCLYPYFEFNDAIFAAVKNKVHWLVDFNNRAFPEHYKEEYASTMLSYQEKVTASNESVVLSSYTLLEELKKYYPNFNCNVCVLRFASTLPNISLNDIELTKLKFKVDVPYFMSPNQFWEHKNQKVVLEALKIIREYKPNLKFRVLFTGSLEVNRGKGYYVDILHKLINNNSLDDYVSFLGVLERKEQLSLMKGSIALIQPSLYEGWSTLVEEAKALNKFILLSDLPVHREQINDNVDFFDPNDSKILANYMILHLEGKLTEIPIDYSKDILAFGRNVINTLKLNSNS